VRYNVGGVDTGGGRSMYGPGVGDYEYKTCALLGEGPEKEIEGFGKKQGSYRDKGQ